MDGLIVCKYGGCTLLAIVGVVFYPMNCNRDIIPTYSANYITRLEKS